MIIIMHPRPQHPTLSVVKSYIAIFSLINPRARRSFIVVGLCVCVCLCMCVCVCVCVCVCLSVCLSKEFLPTHRSYDRQS